MSSSTGATQSNPNTQPDDGAASGSTRSGPHILFATAEITPLVAVGGLAFAAAGLVKELSDQGSQITVVLPDYGRIVEGFNEATAWNLPAPEWCGPMVARRGSTSDFADVILISTHRMERPHPYDDPSTGVGWGDNTDRFFAFSAGVAALCGSDGDGGIGPDLLHLNDWHTSATVGFLERMPPTVLTIHTLGYQGVTGSHWMHRIPHRREVFGWYDVANPLAGAIRTADRIIAVSPNYASEILTPEEGMGMDGVLANRGGALIGIRNGIDVSAWNPATDPHLAETYTKRTLKKGKEAARAQLLERFGWDDDGSAIIGLVSRLVDQKGIDTLLATVPYLEGMNARLAMLGSGQADLTQYARHMAANYSDRVVGEFDTFDEPLSHLIFAGSDLFVMPSRFEPCGLAQMQAMSYGTPPIATRVGGLVDTIIDADDDSSNGTGFLTRTNDLPGLVDAMHRAVRARSAARRFTGIRKRGMDTDWSWTVPARTHIAIYNELLP